MNCTLPPAPTLKEDQFRIAWLVCWFIVSVLPLCVAVALPALTNAGLAANAGLGAAQDPGRQGTGSCTAYATVGVALKPVRLRPGSAEPPAKRIARVSFIADTLAFPYDGFATATYQKAPRTENSSRD